jgi:error-prone DNA polymerase
LAVQGKVQREGRVIHVIADRLVDFTDRLNELTDGEAMIGDHGMAHADEVRSGVTNDQRAVSVVRARLKADRAASILPPSRDFH